MSDVALAQQQQPDTTKPDRVPVTGKVRAAIEAMIWQGLPRDQAAQVAGISEHGLYKALRKAPVKAWYLAELEVEKLKEILPVTIFRPSVVVGDSETGETMKYDGIYYLIHYLRKSPALLRLFNVGNKKVKLNLVPVDFVVDGIAALSHDEKATGKTIALADPDPLTTAELFDTIATSMTGSRSVVTPHSSRKTYCRASRSGAGLSPRAISTEWSAGRIGRRS